MNVPAHPLLEGLLRRPTDRTGGCQSLGNPYTPWEAPWRDSQREDDKTKLYNYVRNAPEGTPLVKIVRDVFRGGSPDYENTDYKLARRFFERHDMFLIAKRGGDLQPGCEEIDEAERTACEARSLDMMRERFADPHPDEQLTHPSLKEE